MDRRVPTHLLQAPELQGHTEEEVYQVVQALAESGYPDPTPDDVANVFRYVGSERDEPRSPVDEEEEVEEYVQPHHHHRVEDPSHPSSMPPHPAVMQDAMRMLHATTPTTATATPATAGHTSRGGHGIMVQHQQQHKPRPTTAISRGGARAAWNANTAIDEPPAHRRRAMEAADRHRGGPARSSSAVLLNPTTRLERYVKKYERALNGFYERHPHMMIDPTSAEGWQPPSSRVALRNISNQHRDVYAEKGEEEVYGMSGGPARHVLSMPLHHDGPSASTARRTANLIYDHTGDARYRFRPAPHDPTPLSGASGRLYATSATPRHRGQPLSSLAVGHLHADGSTLARRADPVRRGEEMRAMWRRDRFLSGGK